MSQSRASQIDPLQEQLLAAQVAAAQGRNQLIPQEMEGAAADLAAKQFALEQSRNMAPIAQQQAAAQLAATQAGPGMQSRALDLEQRQLEQQAAHQAALQRAQQEQNQAMQMKAVLETMQTGGVPGMQANPEMMAAQSGGLLRPAGNIAGFNQLFGTGNMTGAAEYLGQNPQLQGQVDPQVMTQLALQATGGQAPGVAGPGPQIDIAPTPWWEPLTMGLGAGKRLIDYLGQLRGSSEATRNMKTR